MEPVEGPRPLGYLLAAGVCSLLAFANAPVGPTSYSPALTGLRPLVAADSTLVLAPQQLLDEEQGYRYIAWELRGGRVCIESEDDAGATAPPGVRFVVTTDGAPGRRSPACACGDGPIPTCSGTVAAPSRPSDCPLIAVRQARQGPPP